MTASPSPDHPPPDDRHDHGGVGQDAVDGHHEHDGGDGDADEQGHVDRADRLQERFAIPVLVAALASVPAVFLTLFDDPFETVGNTVNLVSGAVLVAEAVVPFVVSQDRLRWLRRNLWLVALAAVIVPAVVFSVGPVQLLRLLRLAGALRIIRVGRILRAGKMLRRRADLDHTWQRVVTWAVSVLVAGFVAVVLADPTSESRQLLEGLIDLTGPVPAVIAGVLLALATFIVVRTRRAESSAPDNEPADDA